MKSSGRSGRSFGYRKTSSRKCPRKSVPRFSFPCCAKRKMLSRPTSGRLSSSCWIGTKPSKQCRRRNAQDDYCRSKTNMSLATDASSPTGGATPGSRPKPGLGKGAGKPTAARRATVDLGKRRTSVAASSRVDGRRHTIAASSEGSEKSVDPKSLVQGIMARRRSVADSAASEAASPVSQAATPRSPISPVFPGKGGAPGQEAASPQRASLFVPGKGGKGIPLRRASLASGTSAGTAQSRAQTGQTITSQSSDSESSPPPHINRHKIKKKRRVALSES